MAKKKGVELDTKVIAEWDPESKEPWLLEFEKQPVNDERWSCLVTTAIPAKIEDDECIQTYKQSVASGSRRAIKILSMSDVINLLKGSESPNGSKKGDKKQKGEKLDKTQKKEEKPPSPRFNQILNLVLKYATFNDFECKLPPGLMAVVLKYMILKLKETNIREKKIFAVKQRKMRERKLKAKFIKDLKPFKTKMGKTDNISEGRGPNDNDEPFIGPDLYIMLTDFFDIFYFPELIRINVPLVAFLKILYVRDGMASEKFDSSVADKTYNMGKEAAVQEFWKNLRDNCSTSDKTWQFKDIAFVKYTPTLLSRHPANKENNNKMIFDEMSWIQYAAYRIYCQHQKYIQQLYVQKVTMSLEPLDLSKCEVYNKLCDALITGQPLTPLFVLYAMIEQLVVGIPETESTDTELDIKVTNFFPVRSGLIAEESSFSKNSTVNLVTPCLQCRDKVNDYVKVCEASFDDNQSTDKSERSNYSEHKAAIESNDQDSISLMKSESNLSNKSYYSGESSNLMALIDQVLGERKTEKEIRKEKNWKPPRLCFYGDSVTLQTYHCDPRIINPEELVHRFMKNADLMKIWTKYPELPPGEKAFYNFHFNSFVKIFQEKKDSVIIKTIFALLMKIAGTSKFYVFKGDEQDLSHDVSVVWKNNQKNSSEMKFCPTLLEKFNNQYCFSNFFFGTFILDLYNRAQRKTVFQIHNLRTLGSSDASTVRNESYMYLTGNRSSVTYNPHNFINLGNLPQTNTFDQINDVLLTILDCFDISTLSDFNFVNQFEEFHAMVDDFSFYEKLQPALMIQRLLECRENYNTIHCTYFPPTDNLAVLMHNDSDHRGIFFRIHSGSLPTPVALRDFYNHVYPEIGQWVIDEVDKNVKFVSTILEKEKAKEEKKDEEFLTQLKLSYCQLSEARRKEFLEEEVDFTSEPEVKENELRDLPYKIGVHDPSKDTPFVVTNLGNLRVETCQKVHEFHSKDGTEVRVVFDGWLHETSEILILTIIRFSLSFRYSLFLRNEERNQNLFTLKTASDITFAFFKDPEPSAEEPAPFNLRISWPTGLLVEVKSASNLPDSNRYIKQSYIKTYRKGWEIEEEKLRCNLKNGEIIIMKETGDIKILTGSGTVHNIFYGEVPLYETITMTGEVWEQLIVKTNCRKRRKISTLKIYLGVDCKTRETYYKRDDGTSCMLWPNGKLVTNYPDGTKITSTPDFDEDGVTVEWDEEEKLYFQELESKLAGNSQSKSRTSMRSKGASQRCLQSNEFVSVSCTYLMEHPKYSTVYSEPSSSLMEIRMQENLKIKTVSEGCYEVQKDNNYLSVDKNLVRFETRCDGCEKSSTAVIDFDSTILCDFVDLLGNEFVVHRNGETTFHENIAHSEDLVEEGNMPEKKNDSFCFKQHVVNIALKQKCFLLERDLSGVEFIHKDYVAHYCYDLQDDSHFDLNTDDPNAISHTFSSSLSKIGYENWTMHYEKDDSLPTNLKKKDLKGIEVKENPNKLFKYPFPQSQDVAKCESNNQFREKINMPKIKLVRILKCFPFPGPKKVISDICVYARQYQKRALDICNKYDQCKTSDYEGADNVKMRLKKIAVTLSQTLTLYPHVCTQLPSTEKDVHYFGHLVNRMEEMRSHFCNNDLLPKCKQIPRCLPRVTDFPTIREENESHHC